MMYQVAILDDYTNAALTSSDWDVLPDNYKITVFNDNLIETDALVKRLTEFDIVCAMRERTPFTSEVFNALPNLKLFVTTGMRNAAVDIAAANKNGVTVCGTGGSGMSTPEHTWAVSYTHLTLPTIYSV